MSAGHEPEGPLRRLFEELESGFDAGVRKEDEQAVAASLRAQAAETALWEVLARRTGTQVVAIFGDRRVRGTLLATYSDFFVLREANGQERLVRIGAHITVGLPVDPGLAARRPPGSGRRYSLALALRELSRRRELVAVELVDGTVIGGMVEAVGSDYLEVDERPPEERRDPADAATTAPRRLIPLAAVAAVSLPQAR